jgi:hypothetical protein
MIARFATHGTRRYTLPMRSVADLLRQRTVALVLALPLAARVELALALGDEDLDLFARTSGLPRDEALARLRARHLAGRRPSRVIPPPAP